MATGQLRAFGRSRSGAVAITVALASVVLFVAAGVAIDMARAYRAKHALQIDVDQAAIAAATVAYNENPNQPDLDQMEQVAANFFSTNNRLSSDLVAVTEPPQFSYVGPENNLVISVPARLDTTFLKIIDINEINFTVKSKVARPEWGPLELVLALDNTYSMSESLNGTPKYQTLQTAAKALVNQLLQGNPNAGNAAIGLVPFATYLRVDQPYWSENWLRVPAPFAAGGLRCTYPKKRGCTWVPPRNFPCVVDGAPATCHDDGYETCTDWGQPFCQNQPGPVFSFGGCFSSRPGLLDRIDETSVPYQGRSPFWDRNSPCAQVPMLDLTKSGGRNALLSRIGAMVPTSNNDSVTNTYTAGGLEFAWHMLTPGKPFDSTMNPDDAADVGLTKAVVLMTDGLNNAKPYIPTCSPNCLGLPQDPQDNQLLWQTGNCGGNMCHRQEPRLSGETATSSLCTKMKNDGILIFTVALNINDQPAIDMLRNCASSPAYFFSANTAVALLDAFKRIGSELRQIRIIN